MIYSMKLQKAVQFASHKHKNQKRKLLDYPYITHPLMVMYLISKFTDNEDVLCAAVLHDTVEDTHTSLEEITSHFGDSVAFLVNLLSEDKSLPQKERKERYYQRLFSSNNNDVFLIKSADILYNLRDMIETFHFADEQKFFEAFPNFETSIVMSFEHIKQLRLSWNNNQFIDDLYHSALEVFQKIHRKGEERKIMREISCGIIPVFVNDAGDKEFLLVLQNNGNYSFPKGHTEEGESFMQTAERELFEETGVRCTSIDDRMLSESYRFYKDGKIIEKTVHYFIGFTDSKEVRIQEEEITDFCWCSEKDVFEKLQFKEIKDMFQKAVRYLNNHS